MKVVSLASCILHAHVYILYNYIYIYFYIWRALYTCARNVRLAREMTACERCIMRFLGAHARASARFNEHVIIPRGDINVVHVYCVLRIYTCRGD